MRLDWAIPCRYAEVNGGLATIVGAQVDAVRVTQFPARTTLTLGSPNPEKAPGWEGSHLIATFVQFDAQSDGTHTFELYVDGRHEQTLPFSIRGPDA